MSRITKDNWRAAEGVVDLIGEDGATVTVPIAALDGLSKHALRVMSAHENGQKESYGGGWRRMATLPVSSAQLGTMPTQEGPRVVLTLDPQTDVAITFRLTAEMARDVARGLMQSADMLEAEAKAIAKGH